MADKATFTSLVEKDKGAAFFDFLQHRKRAGDFSLKRLDDPGWFIGYSRVISLADMDKVISVDSRVANPGPFYGEVDFFSLGVESASAAVQEVFSKAEEYRAAIQELSVYKVSQQIGIRVPSDWLNLGSQWTKARSYYTLQEPQNTLKNCHLREGQCTPSGEN